ncbi:MAG: hypothetical protein ACK4UK_03445 [Flavobacterium sp.]
MKTIKSLNLVAIGTPITLALIGILAPDFLVWALLSTMFTGGLQVILAFALLAYDYRNKHVFFYLLGVVVFFVSVAWVESTYLAIIPPFLCLYLTLIIYTTD